jgi:hypothetical protein
VALAALASGSAVAVWRLSRSPSAPRAPAAVVVAHLAAHRGPSRPVGTREPSTSGATLAPVAPSAVPVALSAPAVEGPAVIPAPLGRGGAATTPPRPARKSSLAAASQISTGPATRATTQDRRRAADEGEELRLLARAQHVLAADPAQALALAAEHERRFPVSAMDQERDVIAVTALLGLGRSTEARRRADRFAREHPGSAYSARIRSIVLPTSTASAPTHEER